MHSVVIESLPDTGEFNYSFLLAWFSQTVLIVSPSGDLFMRGDYVVSGHYRNSFQYGTKPINWLDCCTFRSPDIKC